MGLTDRETEVLVLLARGLSNRDMAERLYLSQATIKTHVSSLLGKLGVQSRVQAVILAYEYGVVRAGDREPGEAPSNSGTG
jgi:DNA-binding NarL/FixJ family response regulator